ncbi:hypothetical protein LINPERHAP1_LOCUS31052 [Linum perenne]
MRMLGLVELWLGSVLDEICELDRLCGLIQ